MNFNPVNSFASRLIGPTAAFALMAYFSYHTVQGDRGVLAWKRLTHSLEEAHLKLSDLKSQREALELRVKLLKPSSLSLDMLGEQARSVLSYARLDEVVIKEEDIFEDPILKSLPAEILDH